MKVFKKLICLMLGVIMIVSVAACGGGDNPDKDPNKESGGNHEVSPGITETITETDTYLFQNGVSDYKIVIPANAGESTRFAATELQYFIKDANGFEMPVISDAGLTFNEDDKYLALGDTTIAEGAGLTATEEEVGWDGFKIKTYGNTVVMVSSSDNGSINAAYGWLQRNMGYHYYSNDEWVINKSADIKLMDIEAKEKPTFNGRWIDFAGNGVASADYDMSRFFTRTRQTGGMGNAAKGRTAYWANNNDQSMESQIWDSKYAVGVTQIHSQTGVAVPWTTDNGTMDTGQICLSTMLDGLGDGTGVDLLGVNEAFTSFTSEFINKSFAVETDNRLFFLGVNDNTNNCKCKECMAYYSKIKESGLMVKFVNAVNDVFKAWLNDELNGQVYSFANHSKYPSYQFANSPADDSDRRYMLGFFSYWYTIDPPANWDDNVGDYVAVDDVKTVWNGTEFTTVSLGRKVACDDEVFVRIAPIQDVNMYSHLNTEFNPNGAKSFSAWAKCTQHLTVWDYGTNFNSYLAPYPDWSTLQENFLIYEEKGVLDIFTQLAAHTDGVAFNRMMIYLRTQLMWNAHQDFETLVVNFMNAYYKDAGPIIKEYFDYIRAEYEMLRLKGGSESQGGYVGNIYGKVPYTCWTYPQILQMQSFFDRAFQAIEHLKTTDYDTYAKAESRLTTESLFYRYVMIDRFSNYYPTSDVSDMIDDFENDAKAANLTGVGRLMGGNGTADRLETILPQWRSSKLG